MTTTYEVLAKADELLAALQGLIDGGQFDAYRQSLSRRHAALFSARDRFAGGDNASILSRIDAAITRVNNAAPNDSSVSGVDAAVDSAITALKGG